MILEICISLFLFIISYIISVTFTSIFYHRALCHNAMILHPLLKKFIYHFGFLITAIDPAIWICTHRLHHLHSDTERDPHSPKYFKSLWEINLAHLRYYSLLNNSLKRESEYSEYIKDLNLKLHPLMRLPNIPFLNISLGNVIIYLLHIGLYYLIYLFFGKWSYPLAIALGLLSHPVQGVLVNYFGHIGSRFGGYRNCETDDQSVNNQVIAYLIFGEGYQNNHHANPSGINFALKKDEYDFGFTISKILRKLGFVSF